MSKKLARKTVAIIVAHEFEDVELLFPILRLSEEGAKILVVPVQDGFHPRPHFPEKPITGRFGHTVPIPVMAQGQRYTIVEMADLDPDKVDCIMFPGGYSPDILRLHEPTLNLVRQFDAQDKLIASICHGPWVLISARIVKGKKIAGWDAVKDDVINAGGEFIDTPAIRDGNLITGRVPDDLPEFCQEIIKALAE